MDDKRFDQLARALGRGASRRAALKLFGAGALAGAAGLRGSASAAPKDKVTLCHKPGTADQAEITVSENAVPAHLAHGDTEGTCPPTTTTTTTTTVAPTTTTTTTTPPLGGNACVGNYNCVVGTLCCRSEASGRGFGVGTCTPGTTTDTCPNGVITAAPIPCESNANCSPVDGVVTVCCVTPFGDTRCLQSNPIGVCPTGDPL